MTCVYTATGLLVAFSTHCADQRMPKRGLEHLFAAYGRPQVIESDQGTHFTGHTLQQWVRQLGIKWKFHVLYNPTAAGMIERHNGLLKSRLQSDTNSLRGCLVHLWTGHLNLRPPKGAPSLIDMLTHMAASPIQLQVQTKEESLKPRFGNQNNILLPAPAALNPRDSTEWT